MRGRYMAVFGLSVSIPAAVGPFAAGIVLDNYPPNLLWHLAVLLCAVSAAGFCALHATLGGQPRFAAAAAGSGRAALAIGAEHG
jgi:MFS family permease